MRRKLIVLACFAALVLSACGTGAREDDAAAVSKRFHAALEAGDGRAACAELSEETASKLEQQDRMPCEKAILAARIPKGGAPAVERVEITTAYVALGDGSADFLDQGPDGWRISAAGCRPTGADTPYACELEG